jgi:hypothetical protein
LATPRKHWFRVADSVLNEAWSNNELAALIRLMAYLNTRWARSGLGHDEACSAEIPTAAVMQITGRGRADIARSSLERLAILTGISVQCSPKVCLIEWPKWADFQELRSRKRPEIARESPCPHPHPQTHKKREEKKESEQSAADAAPRGGLQVSNPPPPQKPPLRDPSPEALEIFDLLVRSIQQSMPGASVPPRGADRWRRWCVELERLHVHGEPGGRGGFEWKDIGDVVEWLPTHERGDFRWGLVIRSATKFRKHFARLLAEFKGGAGGETPDARISRMAREYEEERA